MKIEITLSNDELLLLQDACYLGLIHTDNKKKSEQLGALRKKLEMIAYLNQTKL